MDSEDAVYPLMDTQPGGNNNSTTDAIFIAGSNSTGPAYRQHKGC